ncbi:MAG: hypothetical protein FJW36_00710 [Acidobacteria bacterium]|nr:hypothetical protein [Acidobacteriota bacterium]
MDQNIPKQQIGYVLLTLSAVLFALIFFLFYRNLTGEGGPIAVPLGLIPIALLNSILGANLIAKVKP